MKQFYSFENEQGDWTICYGESPDDTESQVICSVDDWHLETVSMLNSIVTEIVNRYADEVRFHTDKLEKEIFRLQELIHKMATGRIHDNSVYNDGLHHNKPDYPCPICGKYTLDCNCGHGL